MEEKFDVFQWANEIDEIKNNVSCELFLFNKNYTPYKVRYSDSLTGNVKEMFMNAAIKYIIEEADKGLECRDYELSDGEDKVIYRTELSKVGRAETLIHLIEHEYKDIDYFSDNEYEFKKVKGIIAKFTYPGGDDGTKIFYIAKGVAASSALKGAQAWELNGESFEPFSAEVAIKMPADNQVAIIGDAVLIFNQPKFETLFQYDYKSQVIAEEKAKELQEKYKLSFSEGLTLDDGAAIDVDGAAVGVVAAADARAVLVVGVVGRHRAAVDGDAAVGAVRAAADGRAVLAALGGNGAAVDGDAAAGLAAVAADARALAAAVGIDGAAVDDDIAVAVLGIAADGRAFGGVGFKRARAAALAVEGQRLALGDVQALHGQGISVAQDQVRVAREQYAPIDRDVAAQIVPPLGQLAVAGY